MASGPHFWDNTLQESEICLQWWGDPDWPGGKWVCHERSWQSPANHLVESEAFHYDMSHNHRSTGALHLRTPTRRQSLLLLLLPLLAMWLSDLDVKAFAKPVTTAVNTTEHNATHPNHDMTPEIWRLYNQTRMSSQAHSLRVRNVRRIWLYMSRSAYY